MDCTKLVSMQTRNRGMSPHDIV